MSRVTTPWAFALVWALIGLALAGALYDACFSFVIHRFPHDARRVITRITLVAGFAGTVSFPTAAWTAAAFGWRGSLVVFACLILGVAVPLIWSVGPEAAAPSSTIAARLPPAPSGRWRSPPSGASCSPPHSRHSSRG